jgi:cholesterol oxidase
MSLSDVVDFVIVGSGFGGAVAALRLTEKGHQVVIIEEGKRWRPEDFPKTNWNLRKYLWLPHWHCFGIQRIDYLGDVVVLRGAGVGGGSLVYANTLIVPPDAAFASGWPEGFRERLHPHYRTVQRMLGATPPPRLWPAEEHLRDFARSLGREQAFAQPPVGIVFGEKAGERVPDPYFAGRGPERATCQSCGGCMVGCRHNAKNTLDRNYLHLAEQLGARIVAETRVTQLEEEGGGYRIHVRSSTAWSAKPQIMRARQVVLAAGALGTVELLLASQAAGSLKRLSPRLGQFVRSNSEVICAARELGHKVDHSQGIAIASHFQASPDTSLEIVRYPAGSDAMGLLGTLAAPGSQRFMRILRWLGQCVRHPWRWLVNTIPFGFAKRSVIVLAMQTVDNALRLVRKKGWLGGYHLRSRRDGGTPAIPSYLPLANQAAHHVAERMGGFPLNSINEVLLGVPITAHILGGARMADSPDQGVVDPSCRVFGHPGLFIVDGSAIPANLGANPSLTIAAVAEYAMSLVRPKLAPTEVLDDPAPDKGGALT